MPRRCEHPAYEVDRVDAVIDTLLPPGTPLDRVAGGFEFTEGPVWARDGALLFSSPNTNQVYRLKPGGQLTVFRSHSGYSGVDIGRYHQPGSNGLTFDPQGRLTLCQHGNRRVVRVEPHGDVTVLADRFEGKRLNSPNDLVYRSDGTLYFTDPPFGLPEVFDDPKKELAFSGVFRVRDGEVSVVDDSLAGPNGLAFSPDERFLYVGNWDPDRKVVIRYAVAPDGGTSTGELFFDMTAAAGEDAIDGIKVDQQGNLWVCGPGGVWVALARRAAPRHRPTARGPAQPRLGRRRRPRALHHGADQRLPAADGCRRYPPTHGGDTMSKGLTVGAVLPDFALPDDVGAMHRLSELQGDGAMVLQLGRGEHCPRERQHHKELLRLQELAPVAFTTLVTILPNDAARHQQDEDRDRRLVDVPVRRRPDGAARAARSTSTPTCTTRRPCRTRWCSGPAW